MNKSCIFVKLPGKRNEVDILFPGKPAVLSREPRVICLCVGVYVFKRSGMKVTNNTSFDNLLIRTLSVYRKEAAEGLIF